MKKLLLTLSALVLCVAGLTARDCGSCNTCPKKSCKRECSPCKRECKPCKPKCYAKAVECEKQCPYEEEQVVEVVVPCEKYVPVMDYKIKKVTQKRMVCPATRAVVGEWSCCEENPCGECAACHSSGISKDSHGVLSNHPLARKAGEDPLLAEKLATAETYNEEHGVDFDYSDDFNKNQSDRAEDAAQTETKKEKKAAKKAKKQKTTKANKKANKAVNNDEMIVEETEAVAY